MVGFLHLSAGRTLSTCELTVRFLVFNDSSSINSISEKVEQRNEAYYAKYTEDVERVKKIMQYLKETKVALPSGWLTPYRFQQLGILLGQHGKT